MNFSKVQQFIFEKLQEQPQRSVASLISEIPREIGISADEVMRQLQLMHAEGFLATVNNRPLEDGSVFLTPKAYPHFLGFDEYSKKFDEYSKSKRLSFKELSELGLKNIEHLRLFNSTLLTLDIGIVGAAITAFATRPDLIESLFLAVLGIVVFVFNAVLIVFITDEVLIGENNKLYERRAFSERTNNEMLGLITEAIQSKMRLQDFNGKEIEKLKEFMTEEEKLNKESFFTSTKFLRIINYTFIAGLIILISSLLPEFA